MRYKHETLPIRAVRQGMSLMPRFNLLLDDVDDVLATSAVGEWVRYKDVAAHYDTVLAIILRAEKRAEVAEKRLAQLMREKTEDGTFAARL